MSISNKDDMYQHDWYEILGIVDIESSNDVINKAARKLGLKYHPDKSTDPKHHELFLLVQKAKEILLDESKRKELNDNIKAKRARKAYDLQREKKMDSKRKKMKDDLEERLKKTQEASVSSNINNSDIEKSNKSIIDRLNKEGLAYKEKIDNEFKKHRKNTITVTGDNINDDNKITQIKIKWKRSRHTHTYDSLYELFKQYGSIEDISFYGDNGNSAIVTYTDISSATKAVDAYATSSDYRLSILLDDASKKKRTIYTFNNSDKNNIASSNNDNATIKDTNDLVSAMKRAIEREKLIRQLEEEDNGNNTSSMNASNTMDNKKKPLDKNNSLSHLLKKYSDLSFLTPEYLLEKEHIIFDKIKNMIEK